ncbi:MAG TPA: PAS domain S-box protein [Rhodoferax sp.]
MANKLTALFTTTASHGGRRVVASVLALLAVTALIAWAGHWAAAKEAAALTEAMARDMEVQVLALRGVAANFNYLPYTAAQHPDVIAALASPQNTALKDRANRYLEDINRQAGSVALYVMDASGTALVASNWKAPAAQSYVDQSYANRPYFKDARAGRQAMFYGIGQTTGDPGLFIATPVQDHGVLLGVVTVKVSLHQIESTWANARDPIMLADKRGIFFMGSVPAWLYHTKRALSHEEVEVVRADKQYGSHGDFLPVPWTLAHAPDQNAYRVHAALNGRAHSFIAMDKSIPELGWSLTVMADDASVAEARLFTWVLGTLTAGLALMGGLFWRLRERRFREQRDARDELEVQVRERTSELQEAHAFRKAMEDSLLVGMRARDLQGRIVYVNHALCEITGYGADELLGRLPPYPYWHPDDLDMHWQNNDASLSGRAALTGFESRILHKDGHEVHTMVYTAPLIDAKGQQNGWMSSVVDISEQKRAEARQRLHDKQLQHSARLASLGEIATTIAHELNQPLMALSNFASAAQAFAQQGNQTLLVDSLMEIKAQAQRSGEIVRRIRSLAQPQTSGMEMCSLNEIIDHMLVLLQAEIRTHDARIVKRLQPGLAQVSGDRVLLGQVILNLVLNSLQAMQDTPVEDRVVEIETLRSDEGVFVHVADRGKGISNDVAAHIFEPFFTSKPDGLGLGMNICRTIIESHRGRLSFRNRPDGGAVFTIQLPGTP